MTGTARKNLTNTLSAVLPVPSENLTPREIEVMTLTSYGKTRGEVSSVLSISEETVKEYIDRVCQKLNATNKTHATTIAILLGLIAPYGYVRFYNPSPLLVPQTGDAPVSESLLSPDSNAGGLQEAEETEAVMEPVSVNKRSIRTIKNRGLK